MAGGLHNPIAATGGGVASYSCIQLVTYCLTMTHIAETRAGFLGDCCAAAAAGSTVAVQQRRMSHAALMIWPRLHFCWQRSVSCHWLPAPGPAAPLRLPSGRAPQSAAPSPSLPAVAPSRCHCRSCRRRRAGAASALLPPPLNRPVDGTGHPRAENTSALCQSSCAPPKICAAQQAPDQCRVPSESFRMGCKVRTC